MKKPLAEQVNDTLNRMLNTIERLTEERDQYKEMFDMQTKLVVDLEMRLLKMEEKLNNGK
jgi:hypothetical protein